MGFIMLCFAGCRPADPEAGALALNPEAIWQQNELVIESDILFEPTPAMSEALEHGVDLELDVITRISRRYGPIAHQHESHTTRFLIRYLPLIEYWQLDRIAQDGEQTSQTFPRFWLLTDALTERLEFTTGLERSMLENGAWQVQVRVQFDRGALPAPMHLPTLFSPEWQLSGPWHTWHFGSS